MKLISLAAILISVLATACSPAPGAPPVVAPPVDQQILDGAKVAGCVVGDALLGKSIVAIAADCASGAEQLVVDILADFGVNAPGAFGGKLPDQYAQDARVKSSTAKVVAKKR